MDRQALNGCQALFSFWRGCAHPQYLPGHDLQVDGLDRTIMSMSLQSQRLNPGPLGAFHGGGIGQVFLSRAKWKPWPKPRVILAFPQGLQVGNNEGEWQLNTRKNARHTFNSWWR